MCTGKMCTELNCKLDFITMDLNCLLLRYIQCLRQRIKLINKKISYKQNKYSKKINDITVIRIVLYYRYSQHVLV